MRPSERHEEFIAKAYGGRRSPSSGSSVVDKGDVESPTHLIECKCTGEPGKPRKRPALVRTFEKVADEAWERDLIPKLALRYYYPESPLADADGWIDLVLTRVADDGD